MAVEQSIKDLRKLYSEQLFLPLVAIFPCEKTSSFQYIDAKLKII